MEFVYLYLMIYLGRDETVLLILNSILSNWCSSSSNFICHI